MRKSFAVALLCVSMSASNVDAQPAQRSPGEPECSLPGYRVFAAHAGVDPVLESAGKALVATEKPFHLAFLSLPGCKVEPLLDANSNWPVHPVSITLAGDVLYDKGTQSAKGVMLRRAGAAESQALEPPKEMNKAVWTPMLSDDGSAVVWLTSSEGPDGRMDNRISVRDLATGTDRSIPLDIRSARFEFVAANVAASEFLVCTIDGRIVVLDGNGQPKGEPFQVSALERCSASFRRFHGGWIAWDNERLDGRAVRLQWSRPDGKDSHEFPLASIESVSVLPDGKRVAVSAPAADRQVGRGAIVVLGLPEGKILFQRELEPFSRPAVAFLDATHLAVTAGSHVEVLTVP